MPKQAEIAEILSGIFSGDAMLTAHEDLVPYSFDGTSALQQMPAAVVFAKRVDEVSRLLEAANRHGLIIVPRGSGTGLRGSIPLEESVVLCLSRMNSILKVDARNLTCLAG
jgi:glycolate oxidase